MFINSPSDLPDAARREWIAEPYVRLEMVTPAEYVGNLMDLATSRRGEQGAVDRAQYCTRRGK